MENATTSSALRAEDGHVFYCFEVISAHLTRGAKPPEPLFDTSVRCPLFVTWNKCGHELRGCIGCLKPLPITSLKDYAMNAAFKDHRFPPMQESELSSLSCTVSLLTDFEQGEDAFDWTVGVHGIMIDFVDPRGVARSAVYLPEVIPEQGWTKAQAVDSLVRKAGFSQPITDSLRKAIRLTRYKSSKQTRSYAEWQLTRQRNGCNGR